MSEPLKVYEFSFKSIYAARTDAEAREKFARDLVDYLHEEMFDVNNWVSEVLERNDHTEWMYRSFEIEESMEEVSNDR